MILATIENSAKNPDWKHWLCFIYDNSHLVDKHVRNLVDWIESSLWSCCCVCYVYVHCFEFSCVCHSFASHAFLRAFSTCEWNILFYGSIKYWSLLYFSISNYPSLLFFLQYHKSIKNKMYIFQRMYVHIHAWQRLVFIIVWFVRKDADLNTVFLVLPWFGCLDLLMCYCCAVRTLVALYEWIYLSTYIIYTIHAYKYHLNIQCTPILVGCVVLWFSVVNFTHYMNSIEIDSAVSF